MKYRIVLVTLMVFFSIGLMSLTGAPNYFDWRRFGAETARSAPNDPLQKAIFIVDAVGRELNKQGIKPNSTILGRAEAYYNHNNQALGTCNDLAEIVTDALNGGGFPGSSLSTVMASKRGAARLNKGWLFDMNLDHVTPVVVIGGKAYTFDLWMHGGVTKSFGGFRNGPWNALYLKGWADTLKRFGYSTYTFNPGKPAQISDTSIDTVQGAIIYRAGASADTHSRRDLTPTTSPQDDALREYRALYPEYLRAYHKANHRVEIVANAVPSGNGYRCAYKAYDIVTHGYRKGQEYVSTSFDRVLSLGEIKSLNIQMKKSLGK